MIHTVAHLCSTSDKEPRLLSDSSLPPLSDWTRAKSWLAKKMECSRDSMEWCFLTNCFNILQGHVFYMLSIASSFLSKASLSCLPFLDALRFSECFVRIARVSLPEMGLWTESSASPACQCPLLIVWSLGIEFVQKTLLASFCTIFIWIYILC